MKSAPALLLALTSLALSACERSSPGIAGGHLSPQIDTLPSGQATLTFSDGTRLETHLHQVRYIGRLPSQTKSDYVVLSGRGCTECDAGIQLYIHSPSDGALGAEAEQPNYPHPGLLQEWNSDAPGDTIAERGHAFIGECISGNEPVVVWLMEERTAPGILKPVTYRARVVADSLRFEAVEPGIPLGHLRARVQQGRCREIASITQPRPP